MFVCARVCPRLQAIKTIHVRKRILNNHGNQTSPILLFQFLYRTLAINITDERGLIVTKRVSQVNAVLVIHFTVKGIYNQLYITNKTERFSFNSGRASHLKED